MTGGESTGPASKFNKARKSRDPAVVVILVAPSPIEWSKIKNQKSKMSLLSAALSIPPCCIWIDALHALKQIARVGALYIWLTWSTAIAGTALWARGNGTGGALFCFGDHGIHFLF
jgi:hypothetical protein